MNTIKTGLLLGALTGLLMLIGGFFGGQQGVVIAFIFAMVMNFGSYWFSDKLVLKMYQAQAGIGERGAGALRHREKSRHEGLPAHAAGLYHPRRHAERLCHRTR